MKVAKSKRSSYNELALILLCLIYSRSNDSFGVASLSFGGGNIVTHLRLSNDVLNPSSKTSSSPSTMSSSNASNNKRSIDNIQSNFSESNMSSISQAQATTNRFVKPTPRIVPNDPTKTPILYVYDHCPFCVRVRLALGLKNVKHNLVFLANDDVSTPTELVGKKISPILKIPAAKRTLTATTNTEDDDGEFNDFEDEEEEDFVMIESMDIIDFFENDERFGPTNILKPASGRTDLKKWQKSVQMLLRTLQRPRYVATGLLPEFQQLDSRHAFIKNHPLPPYNKDEWKAMEDLNEKLSIYAEAIADDPAYLIEELNAKLVALDDIVYCDMYCTEGGLSLDDIDLWARLRSVTIIQDVTWPDKLRRYMDNLSELADISLYDGLAI